MLNISENSVSQKVRAKGLTTLEKVESKKSKRVLINMSITTLILAVVISFLPWTQNIRSGGTITTIKPNQKPQTIHSVIAGRIEQWYVQDGQMVREGDTILRLSEIKTEYFDDQLIPRTKQQLALKEQTVVSYIEKIQAIESQWKATKEQQALELEMANNLIEQALLAVERDSINYETQRYNYQVALTQFERIDSLYQAGLKSLTERENRFVKQQQAKAYEIEGKNKYLASKNSLINALIKRSNVQTKYQADLAKLQSEKYTAMSAQFDSEALVQKLENQYSNYVYRNSFYYILSPQDGYLMKSIPSGIGETVKEGEALINILPKRSELAVEVYVDPMDIPLLDTGQEVRIQFDGWPAIVFSGWPNTSVGTYVGRIYSIDRFIGPNGKGRVLVQPEPSETTWPEALRFGGGTNNMILLNDVPIWYELWRRINGFPPDFYVTKEAYQRNTGSSKAQDSTKK